MARNGYGERKCKFAGQHFWARGFSVTTVGRDEDAIRDYIRNQEMEDQRLEQMNLCGRKVHRGEQLSDGSRMATRGG